MSDAMIFITTHQRPLSGLRHIAIINKTVSGLLHQGALITLQALMEAASGSLRGKGLDLL